MVSVPVGLKTHRPFDARPPLSPVLMNSNFTFGLTLRSHGISSASRIPHGAPCFPYWASGSRVFS